jgi:hypothetical protein
MFGGPLLLVADAGNSGEVSALFLLLTVARVPAVVLLGVLLRIAFEMEATTAPQESVGLLSWQRRIGIAVVLFASVVALAAAGMGSRLFGEILETDVYFCSSVYALVGASAVLALGSQVITVA